MLLANYFIGIIEDNITFFYLPRLVKGLIGCTDYFGYPTGFCQNLIIYFQPITAITSFLFAKILNPIIAYNIIVIGGLALNSFFSFRFFKKLFGRFISFLLTLIFLTSPYISYQSRSHLDLMQFWPVIWFLDTLFFSKSRHKAIFLGLILTLITGISNYLSYFTILFSVLYLLLKFLFSQSKITLMKGSWREVIKTLVIFILLSGTFMAPYIKSNFFAPRVRFEENIDNKATNRPFEDFIIFSSRPWYYILPSVDNPFFGAFSQKILDQLSSGKNYLTQNYFKSEHSASYLGWVNISLALLGIIMLIRTKQVSEKPIFYPALLVTILGLIILTMPPSVTLRGVTFLTPSYVLFKIFPMFRVLARAGVLILFLVLIFTGFGYISLENLLVARKINHKIAQFVLLALASFSFIEFFVPLKVTHVGTPPKVYSYIGSIGYLKSPIVVYPYNKTTGALFWFTTHRQPLINPRYYEHKETNFVSENFTKLLNTTKGLEEARIMGAKYLVYFYIDDGGKSMNFFENNNLLVHISNFSEEGQEEQSSAFIQIIEAGADATNSAILYKFK